MGKRAAGLAQIQNYLTGASSGGESTPAPAPDDTGLPAGAEPHAAPGTQPEPTSKEELQRQTAEANRDRAQIATEREQLKLEQEQKSALEEKTDEAAAKLRQVVNYSKFRLEAIPMPGGLFLPIALLFVFFLALLPIGGKTRLSWLWNVVTGNAELNQAEDVVPVPGTKTGASPTGNTTPTTTTPAILPTPAPVAPTLPTVPIAPFFTGVEQGE